MFIVETKDIPLRTLLYVLLILIIFIVNIFVAKLSSTTTSEDLQALFSEHGSVSSAKVIMDRESGRSRGFGFVEMVNDGDGQKAIDALNGAEFEKKVISVSVARPRSEKPSGGYRERRGGYNSSRRYKSPGI